MPFLVGGVQEQMGGRNSPSHLGCAPHPSSKDPLPGPPPLLLRPLLPASPHHRLFLLDTNEKFKTQLGQKIGLWVRSKDPGILVLREGS